MVRCYTLRLCDILHDATDGSVLLTLVSTPCNLWEEAITLYTDYKLPEVAGQFTVLSFLLLCAAVVSA